MSELAAPAGLTLATVIRQHQEATGDSYADISQKTGLSKSQIGLLARSGPHFQARQDTLERLSQGLGLPLATVQRAAIGTAGWVLEPGPKRDLIERLEALDDETVQLVAKLLDDLLRLRDR